MQQSELTPVPETAADTRFDVTSAYRSYALGLFVLIYVVSFIDRQILSILIEPIRLELGLTDTQLGMLGGFAFAIF